jgi:mono/diheme cytochrome c family protein
VATRRIPKPAPAPDDRTMDFPIFHLDGMGNRMLVAVVAVLHVLINHGLAVGAMPLITALEWWGERTGDRRWDEFAYKFLTVCFVITTTVGAMTGVGIWLTTSLVNPTAIGSLLRVFFWAWFTEWLVFITEVCLILAYYLLWQKWQGARKRAHLRLGLALSVFSWITMSLIVAILGFMMSTGDWQHQPSLLTGVFNPLYLPQLCFRTGLAMISAGLLGWGLTLFFVRVADEFRGRVVRFIAGWVLAWTPVCGAGAWWYWRRIPEWSVANVPTALTTQDFTQWHGNLLKLAAGIVGGILVVALIGWLKPRRLPRLALALPFAASLVLLGYFERVREFIRKPYVIANYLYANGVRVEDMPLYQRDGILPHAAYARVRQITPDNRTAAGEEVFLLACTRCHTQRGMNSIDGRLTKMFGPGPWDATHVSGYLRDMHGPRPFMPPFPGNGAELEALTAWLIAQHGQSTRLAGAQQVGVQPAPPLSAEAIRQQSLTPAAAPTPSFE